MQLLEPSHLKAGWSSAANPNGRPTLRVSTAFSSSSVPEIIYTTAQLAEQWQLSVDTLRSLFEHEPGVLILQRDRRGIRKYRTLRIPASVAKRVYNRLMVPAA
jgi:hypothetical protein